MSEMSEVNHTLPSLNGSTLQGIIGENSSENAASTELKTSIPMQEVSAVREEPVPAAAHYLPGDDRSTAAAASAATQDSGTVSHSYPGGHDTTKEIIEGPGHESDIRNLNGSGLASTFDEESRSSAFQSATIGSGKENMIDNTIEEAPRSLPVQAPGTSNPYNRSEEQSMTATDPIQSMMEPTPPAPAAMTEPASSVSATETEVKSLSASQNLFQANTGADEIAVEPESTPVAAETREDLSVPLTTSSSTTITTEGSGSQQQPSLEAVSMEKEAILSPVKMESKTAAGVAEPINQFPESSVVPPTSDGTIVSSIDEPALISQSKVEEIIAPLNEEPQVGMKDVDVSMEEIEPAEKDPDAMADVSISMETQGDSSLVAAQGIAASEPIIAENDVAAPAAPSTDIAPQTKSDSVPIPSPKMESAESVPSMTSAPVSVDAPVLADIAPAPLASAPESAADAPGEDMATSVVPSGEEEPPSKRQRKSVSLGFNTHDGPKAALAGPESTSMTGAQIKFCQNAIKALKSRPEAGPFLAPVDYMTLGLPHYPDKVKQPMDFGTIDIRLALTAAANKGGNKPTEKTKQASKWGLDPVKDVFPSVEAFERDVRLVFTNCEIFNGPEHVLTINAKTLEGVFDKQLKTLPSAGPTTPAATAESEAAAFDTSFTSNGSIRRASDVASRPKRDIHPPAPKDLPYADRPQSAPGTAKKKKFKRPLTAREEAYYDKIAKEQVKYVTKFIDDLHKPPLSKFAWVFFNKPTMDMDFAQSYYSIIKQPISLKEIKERLVHGDYDGIEGAQEDLDLMLNNCFTFNPPDSDVYAMGKEVQKAWQSKLAKMPQPQPLADDEEEEDEEDEESTAQAQMIRDQIASLQAQLEGLTGNSKAAGAKMLASAKASLAAMPGKKASKKRRPSESSGSNKKGGVPKKQRTPSAGTNGNGSANSSNAEAKKARAKKQNSNASSGKKRDDDDIRDVTYEQKEELAAKITQLPDDRLDGALKIIAEDKPPSANDDEEIELDIDDLSPQTLYKLYRYVVRPKGKKPPSKVSASDGRKRGTGGVKRKNLDEGEEAARIARLQEQLQQFDNPESKTAANRGAGGGGGQSHAGAHDDLVASESSSGEDDYDSESEFE